MRLTPRRAELALGGQAAARGDAAVDPEEADPIGQREVGGPGAALLAPVAEEGLQGARAEVDISHASKVAGLDRAKKANVAL